MAEPTLYTFGYKEAVEALIKQQDLHEGIWQIYVEFSLGAANIPTGPNQDSLMPAAIIPLSKIGIMKVDKETNLSVDAEKVNPAKKKE